MPRGVYDRTKKAAAAPASAAAEKPQKRAYKRTKAALVPKASPTNGAGAVAPFGVSVDLRAGAVTVNARNGSLKLAPDEVLALFAFLAGRVGAS